MHLNRTLVTITTLCAALALEGCYPERPWIRIWGKGRDEAAAQPATAKKSADPSEIVTGAEGEMGTGVESGTPVESVVGMPDSQPPAAPPPAATPVPTEMPTATAQAEPPAAATPGANDQLGGAPAAAEPPPQGKVVTLQADALFAFGKSDLTAVGKGKLDELAARIKGMDPATLSNITVIGHADRLGSADRNQALSEYRAEAVRSYLVGHGLDAALIRTEGRGSSEPISKCSGDKPTKKLIACLAPDRRVEVVIGSR